MVMRKIGFKPKRKPVGGARPKPGSRPAPARGGKIKKVVPKKKIIKGPGRDPIKKGPKYKSPVLKGTKPVKGKPIKYKPGTKYKTQPIGKTRPIKKGIKKPVRRRKPVRRLKPRVKRQKRRFIGY